MKVIVALVGLLLISIISGTCLAVLDQAWQIAEDMEMGWKDGKDGKDM